jgi:hypothetical protein
VPVSVISSRWLLPIPTGVAGAHPGGEQKLFPLDEPFGALDALTGVAMPDILLRIGAAIGPGGLLATCDVNEPGNWSSLQGRGRSRAVFSPFSLGFRLVVGSADWKVRKDAAPAGGAGGRAVLMPPPGSAHTAGGQERGGRLWGVVGRCPSGDVGWASTRLPVHPFVTPGSGWSGFRGCLGRVRPRSAGSIRCQAAP